MNVSHVTEVFGEVHCTNCFIGSINSDIRSVHFSFQNVFVVCCLRHAVLLNPVIRSSTFRHLYTSLLFNFMFKYWLSNWLINWFIYLLIGTTTTPTTYYNTTTDHHHHQHHSRYFKITTGRRWDRRRWRDSTEEMTLLIALVTER